MKNFWNVCGVYCSDHPLREILKESAKRISCHFSCYAFVIHCSIQAKAMPSWQVPSQWLRMAQAIQLSPSYPMQDSANRWSLFWTSPLAWLNFFSRTLSSELCPKFSFSLSNFSSRKPDLNHICWCLIYTLQECPIDFYNSVSALVPVFWRTQALTYTHIY